MKAKFRSNGKKSNTAIGKYRVKVDYILSSVQLTCCVGRD